MSKNKHKPEIFVSSLKPIQHGTKTEEKKPAIAVIEKPEIKTILVNENIKRKSIDLNLRY
jgi:hypothetical protein